MKRLLTTVILLAFILPIIAIRGYVVDPDGKAIESVSVFCGKTGVYTDARGRFQLDTACDSLTFQKIGYRKTSRSAQQIFENPRIVLDRDTIAIEGIEVREERYSSHLPDYAGKRTILVEETASDAASVVGQETGIYLQGGSLPGESRYLSLQGQRTKHTAVMIDGVVVSTPGNAFDLSTIPSSMIERIEIIEGNAGAIAGSGAIGGIINVVTRRDTIQSPDIHIKVLTQQALGSYNLQKNRVDLSVWNRFSKTDLSFNRLYNRADFEYETQQGDTETNPNNAISSSDFGLTQEFFFLPIRNRLQIMYREFSKQMIGRYSMLSAYDDAHLHGNSARMFLDLDKEIGDAQFRLVSHWNRDYTLYDNTGSSSSLSIAKGKNNYYSYGVDQITSINLMSFMNLIPSFTWRTQEYRYDDILSDLNDVDPIRQTSIAPHVQFSAQTEINEHELTTNVDYRYDHVHTDSVGNDAFHSWKVGAQWKWIRELGFSLGGDYGNGFSLPSIYDLYWKGGGQAMGNPDLKPERSLGYTISGSIWWNDILQLDSQWSDQKVDDLIFWHKSVTNWKPDNIGSATVRNFQIDLSASPTPFLSLSASWQRTSSKDSSGSDHDGKFVPGVPLSITRLGITLQQWNAQIGVTWNRVGERYTTQDNLIGAISAYETLDAESRYLLKLEHWKLPSPAFYLKVNNLLDERYEIDLGQPEPGTNWETGIFLEETF